VKDSKFKSQFIYIYIYIYIYIFISIPYLLWKGTIWINKSADFKTFNIKYSHNKIKFIWVLIIRGTK